MPDLTDEVRWAIMKFEVNRIRRVEEEMGTNLPGDTIKMISDGKRATLIKELTSTVKFKYLDDEGKEGECSSGGFVRVPPELLTDTEWTKAALRLGCVANSANPAKQLRYECRMTRGELFRQGALLKEENEGEPWYRVNEEHKLFKIDNDR